MSRTVNITEEVIVVSNGKEDIGKLVVLGDGGKFDTSVIPEIDNLQTQITAETTARKEADTKLQSNIDAEALARSNADAKLQSNIDTEASVRTAADSDLQAQITQEVADRTTANSTLQANIDAEATARTAADTTLQSNIDAEASSRSSADQDLQSQVTAEVAARTEADMTLQTNIDTEVATRTAADQSLQDQITVLNGENAFANVLVNGTTIAASSKTDTVELAAGTNIALTVDAENKKVTIAVDGKVASAEAADTAAACTKLAAARTIALTGAVLGSGSFDGSGDLSITTSAGSLASIPTGTILPYAGSSAPTGYLLCDGSAVSRTTYASLYSVVGTTYGTGDGSTTFNVPNLKDKFMLGKGATYATLATTGGEATHTLTVAEMPAHTHTTTFIRDQCSGTSGNAVFGDEERDGTNDITSGSTGGGGAHNNMPPYIVVNYCIKY
ncbi:MAG: exported protein of unknown function [Firmicutes bacterium]|nr:exported protein of unknown function [Bacillota bacterium]